MDNLHKLDKLALGLVALAIAGRLIPHPDNFTPLAAIALFTGAVLPGWRSWAIIAAALFLSDLALGYLPDLLSLGVYAGLFAGGVLGRMLGSRRGWRRLAGAATANSIGFFIITNFVVWALPAGRSEVNYAHNIQGLMECYAMALPFFRNALAGDLFWTLLLFGAYGWTRNRLGGTVRA